MVSASSPPPMPDGQTKTPSKKLFLLITRAGPRLGYSQKVLILVILDKTPGIDSALVDIALSKVLPQVVWWLSGKDP